MLTMNANIHDHANIHGLVTMNVNMIYPVIHFPCQLLRRCNGLTTHAVDIDAI